MNKGMMRIIVVFLVSVLFSASAIAQDITGPWYGKLEIPGSPLRLVLHIERTESGYRSTLDSPDQGSTGIPVDTTTFENQKLDLFITALGLTYSGELSWGTFNGTFTQGGFSLPLELSREPITAANLNRPQEPKAPFPYYSEEVQFPNEDANIRLAGTLTLPETSASGELGRFPVAVMITGSGPQNRDEELSGHKPFLVIADYLTRNGIGVLRFDDRGTEESTGDFKSATSADFATDVQSAVTYLQTREDIDENKIGLIGHSEGGIIAPMVAANNKDIGFVVLMAGIGVPGSELLATQGRLIGKAAGQSNVDVETSAVIRQRMIDMALESEDVPGLRKDLITYLKSEAENEETRKLVPAGVDVDQFIESQTNFMATDWMVYFLRYDPSEVLKNVACPVLA
ncbi:MAG: alpha/beta fold hydrolase, partial [Pricia sp.]